ncbi:isopentenyl-diphosphate Delta-isomerase [Streptomyces virginiae]|uniref:isopentenyl-diphosphate Delta-isomerase n=1 Tax=Streptomyces virginiae TaxID=1961 RepID=UPI003803B152
MLLDEEGHVTGTAPKLASHHRETPLHLAFTAYAFSPGGELLLTRRSAAKKTWPGVWTNTVCGHPRPREPLMEAVRRRVDAELGAELVRAEVVLGKVRYRAVMPDGTVENEMGPVIRLLLDGPVAPDPEETDMVRWTPWETVVAQVLAGEAGLSPWSEVTIARLAALGSDPWAWPTVDPSTSIPALQHLCGPDQLGRVAG